MTPEERAIALCDKYPELLAVEEITGDVTATIRAAVEAERERCLKIARSFARREGTMAKGASGNDLIRAIWGEVLAYNIASSIRAGEGEGK